MALQCQWHVRIADTISVGPAALGSRGLVGNNTSNRKRSSGQSIQGSVLGEERRGCCYLTLLRDWTPTVSCSQRAGYVGPWCCGAPRQGHASPMPEAPTGVEPCYGQTSRGTFAADSAAVRPGRRCNRKILTFRTERSYNM